MNEVIIFGFIYGLIVWNMTKSKVSQKHDPVATLKFNVISALAFGGITAATLGFHNHHILEHFIIFLKYAATGLLVNIIIRWMRQRQIGRAHV